MLGSASDCDVVVADPSVAPRHARLELGPPSAIEVLASRRVTQVGGTPLPAGGRAELAPGGGIQLGGDRVLGAACRSGECRWIKFGRRSGRQPRDLKAHDLYLKGRYFWNKRPGEALRKSLEFFQDAMEGPFAEEPAGCGVEATQRSRVATAMYEWVDHPQPFSHCRRRSP